MELSRLGTTTLHCSSLESMGAMTVRVRVMTVRVSASHPLHDISCLSASMTLRLEELCCTCGLNDQFSCVR